MYFLWKRAPHGSIRVSQEGLVAFLKRTLSAKYQLHGLSMEEGDEATLTLVLSSDDGTGSEEEEESLASVLSPLGLSLRVIWVARGATGAKWREAKEPVYIYKSPWTWMSLAALTALAVNAGLRGVFWTCFWGTAGWFVARFLPVLFRRKKLDGLNAAQK